MKQAIQFIRECRDDADTLDEHILMFVALLVIGVGAITTVLALVVLAFTFPRVCVPLYVSVFLFWRLYKIL